MMPWVPSSHLAQPIILKPVDKPSELTKFLKICSDHVQLFMERVGMNVCPLLNFPTTIVTKQVLGCHHLKLCMGGVVELLSIGRNLENSIFWPDIVMEVEEKVKTIQERLRAA